MKKYLLLLAVSGLFLTSCKKCKDCEYKIDWKITEGYTTAEITELDAQFELLYGMGYEEYYQDLYSSAFTSVNEEYCDDDLEAIEATTDENLPGYYRLYWDCK